MSLFFANRSLCGWCCVAIVTLYSLPSFALNPTPVEGSSVKQSQQSGDSTSDVESTSEKVELQKEEALQKEEPQQKGEPQSSAQNAQKTLNTSAHPPFRFFPWEKEVLYYSVQFNGMETMRAKVQVGEVKQKGDSEYVALAATLQSVNLFSSIYPVNDKANSFLNPYSGKLYRSTKHFLEGGTERTYDVSYRHSEYEADVKRSRNGESSSFVRDIPSTTYDMLSWFFELRRLYPLKVEEPLAFYIYDGWKLSYFSGKVLAKEDLLTPMGWFKAYKLRFVRNVLATSKSEHGEPHESLLEEASQTIDIWVSRDENMLPIKVSLATPWGSGDLVLIKYVPPKNFNQPKPERKLWRRVD